ncbi:B3 domain-containing protein like [Capsicum galapagoense]
MENGSDHNVVVHQSPHDFLTLSLSPPFSEDSVVHAKPIIYSRPPPSPSSTSTVVDFSSILAEDDISASFLSLSPPFSGDTAVTHAESISYSRPPPPSSTSGTTSVVDLSFMLKEDDIDSPFLSLSLPFYENHSEPTLSLFPEFSENLSASKQIGNNSSPPSSTTPVVDLSFMLEDDDIDSSFLSLSLPYYKNLANPTISSKVSKNYPNLATSKPIGNNTIPPSSSTAAPSTDLCLSLPDTPDTTSSTITTLHRTIGWQHSYAKRSFFQETGEDKFVPLKKIKVRKESTPNNPKRQPAAEGGGGHWIIKPLKKSDVNGASRLLLPRQDVKNYILPFMKEEEQAVICNELNGVDVRVYDMDTQTEHLLTLKKWPATNSFQLVKAWTSEFVKRRNLKEDDVILIRWDKNNHRFCFRVHVRNQGAV